MAILTTLQRSGGIDALARDLGRVPADAALGVSCLLPAMLSGMRRAAAERGAGLTGLQSLIESLEALGGGQLAAGLLASDGADPAAGYAVLRLIIGDDDRCRELVHACAATSGRSTDELGRMLPLLAKLVAGYVCARNAGQATLDWLAEMIETDGD